jgi:hypothetical protein
MAAVLKDTFCACCGQHHEFYVSDGELDVSRQYAYCCPARGHWAKLRPDTAGEATPSPPLGGVALSLIPD